jgi:D-Tyr-tRNAtyr deacylase
MPRQQPKQQVNPQGKQVKSEYSADIVCRVPISNPLNKGMGNRTPAELREINIRAKNAKQQLEWAQEEKKATDLWNEYRQKIEALRLEVEKGHFQTEKQIDELQLSAELAGVAYAAHQRELAARKGENVKFINAAASDEIEVVAHGFSERIRAGKAKTVNKKDALTARYTAEIEQEKARGKKEVDPEIARQRAIKNQRMKAYIAGVPEEEIARIGTERTGGSIQAQPALLDRFSFNFGK